MDTPRAGSVCRRWLRWPVGASGRTRFDAGKSEHRSLESAAALYRRVVDHELRVADARKYLRIVARIRCVTELEDGATRTLRWNLIETGGSKAARGDAIRKNFPT